MGTSSCITIKTVGGVVFRVVLIHDGCIRIDPPLGVGDHLLKFLRNEGNREELKWMTPLLIPRKFEEDENDEWMKANFEKYRGNVLEPLLDMLREGRPLEVPNVREGSHISYYYEIDFYRNQLSIKYYTNDVQTFDLSSLPSSQEIHDRVEDTSRRVDLDWSKLEEAGISSYRTRRVWENLYKENEKARVSCNEACRGLDDMFKQTKEALISCDEAFRELEDVHKDLVQQRILSP